MDGNGRWATQRGLSRIEGHRQGVKALKALLRCCKDWGIGQLTVYAFSTENWHRPATEVDFLLGLFERQLQAELDEMDREGVRITFIGNHEALSPSLQSRMQQASAQTAQNQAIRFNVAIDYGGRQDIVRACRRLAHQVAAGELSPDAIDDGCVAQALDTAGMPEPDLLIRTSGEMRLSNFLLWQIAYAEIYVTETLWPDFDRGDFHRALAAYQQRHRRFGKL